MATSGYSANMSQEEIIQKLKLEIAELKAQAAHNSQKGERFYASQHVEETFEGNQPIPVHGWDARHAMCAVQDVHRLDFSERLNTSSYVNVSFEEEEFKCAELGMQINLADQTVYPSSYKLHDTCVNMLANLWHCPEPEDFAEKGVHAGAQTVGSTEACLLAGLCMKFRWRDWYKKKYNKTDDEVFGVRPNLVISTCFQAAWEKLFKYMDIEPRLVPTSYKDFCITASGVREMVDERTIGVVCIMGNHYGGQYDPVMEIGQTVEAINKEKGLIVGIHVDAASGGFIAPFQEEVPAWDFRVPQVLSISASGHKFGLSVCGTGWVIWRGRKGLSEHVAISVSYLGGQGESYTLNFSRPASGVYVQFFKFLRLGQTGYTRIKQNCMNTTKYLREELMKMELGGKKRFELMDAGRFQFDKDGIIGHDGMLPVFAARLNPELGLKYNDIDLQHQLSEEHWYVSGYKLSMTHPLTHENMPLFHDANKEGTMFRVVVKANLTKYLANNLISCVKKAVEILDDHYGQTDIPKKHSKVIFDKVC